MVFSSSVGANYKIWAFQSGDSTLQQSSIKHTTSLVQAFNLLSLHSNHDLNFHLPRLLVEAHRAVAKDELYQSILSSAPTPHTQKSSDCNASTDISPTVLTQSDMDIGEDRQAVENFIFKRGKLIIKDEIRKYPQDSVDSNNNCINPFIIKNENIATDNGEIESYNLTKKYGLGKKNEGKLKKTKEKSEEKLFVEVEVEVEDLPEIKKNDRIVRTVDDPNEHSDLLLPWTNTSHAGLINDEINTKNIPENIEGKKQILFFPPINSRKNSNERISEFKKTKKLISSNPKVVIYTVKNII